VELAEKLMRAAYECLIVVMPEFLNQASGDSCLKVFERQRRWIPAQHTAGMTELNH
jgi:hypothetical protein